MSSWGASVARALALQRPLPEFQHTPFAATELHRAPVSAHDGVLAPALLQAARRQALAAPPRREGTAWLCASASARTPIEQTIRALEALVQPPPGHAGCEWWVQRLGAAGKASSLALHWDKDECEAASGKRMTHPALASVCYLSDSGGPTLVLPVRTADVAGWRAAKRPSMRGTAFASLPRENRLLTFQGNLLHGVSDQPWLVPGSRLTLLVNWWQQKPAAPCCERLTDEHAVAAPAAAPMVPSHQLATTTPTRVCDNAASATGEALWLQLPGLLGGGSFPLYLPQSCSTPGALVRWELSPSPPES